MFAYPGVDFFVGEAAAFLGLAGGAEVGGGDDQNDGIVFGGSIEGLGQGDVLIEHLWGVGDYPEVPDLK